MSDTSRLAHERDYIARTIETVRNHKDADNCWPQWANIFADQIESLEAELERVTDENEALRAALSGALANDAQWWKKAQAALSPARGGDAA
jgi:hypothetical protein